MFEISADVIYFDGKPVATIIVPNGTLRERFEEAVERAALLNELDEQMRDLKSTLDELTRGN